MNKSENIQKDVQYMLIIDDFCPVPEVFYARILHQVEEITHVMRSSKSYTLERLCGEEFWSTLSPAERKTAGRCMKIIVKRKQLPLIPDPDRCQHEYPKRYCLK